MGKTSGIVFDIQRCSLQDGPGIRTTVFLKGCPLRCQWCHNPESIGFGPQLSYDESQCVGCFECVAVCTEGAHSIREGRHALDFSKCQACGKCVEVCEGGALRMIGREHTVDEVMAEVRKDAAFYRRSGGGVTLSGGEPMAQFEFSREILEAARREGIHTCLETSGASSWDRYQAVAPSVDLFLFDYKASGAERHRALTGAGNGLILQNLAKLAASGARIVLRCPLVPGVNDDRAHLSAIADLAARLQLAGVEVMAYHDLGIAKGARVGHSNGLTTVQPPSPEVQERWISSLRSLGCSNARLA
ncbi:MAG TPA: glycyl-radical enzyme activating protein [Fimbriimonas sp.]